MAVTFDELDNSWRNGTAVDIVVRPPGDVTQRYVGVVVVGLDDDVVIVEQADGRRVRFELSALVDAHAERERRRRWRRAGWVVDAFGMLGR